MWYPVKPFSIATSSDVTQVCYCGYIQMVAIAKGENSRKCLSLVWGFGGID